MASVTFAPIEAGPFQVGETLTFELKAEDFPEATAFFGNLTYDAGAVSLIEVTYNPEALELGISPDPLEPAGADGERTIELQAGTLKGLGAGSLLPSGDFTVATLTFEVLQPGETSISFGPTGSEPLFQGDEGAIDVAPPAPFTFDVDVPPDAADDTASVDEDESIGIDVLDNDSDAGGDSFSITELGTPSNGAVTEETDGTLTYTPDKNFNGTDSFSYTITDENGSTDTATVTVTVNPVNDDPVANDDQGFTDQDTPIVIDALGNDTDVDGDTLNATVATGPSNGTVEMTSAGFIYTPNAGYVGDDTFTYDVSDGQGGSDTATVAITVGATNAAPAAAADTVTVDEDGSVTFNVLDNDSDDDGDDLTITSSTAVSEGTLTDNGGGSFTYAPAPDFNGTDSFTYTVNDGNGGESTATVDITVNSVNDDPVAANDTASMAQGGATVIDVLDNDGDADGDDLTIASVGAAANGTVSENPDGTLTYTPNAGFAGSDSFTYEISDGNGGSDTATVDVNVNGVLLELVEGTAPDEVSFVLKTSPGFEPFVGFDFDLTYDADKLAFQNLEFGPQDLIAEPGTVPQNPSGETTITDITGGLVTGELSGMVEIATFNFTPLTGEEVTVSVQGGENGFILGVDAEGDARVVYDGTVETTVVLNTAPDAKNDAATVDEDGSALIDVLANDVDADSDALSVENFSQGANGTVTLSEGVLTYTPDDDFSGTDSFTYTVSDGRGGLDTATVDVTIDPVNDAPVITSGDRFDFVEGDTGTVFTGTATDIDSSDLTFSLAGADSDLFDINAGTGEVTFTTPPTFTHGDDNDLDVTLVVSDGDLIDTLDITVSLLKDSDGDLVPDESDNAINAKNPDQRDTDGDGYGNIIDSDLDNDGFVGILDLILFRKDFGKTGDPSLDADFTGDGDVDVEDVNILRETFGEPIGSSAFGGDFIA